VDMTPGLRELIALSLLAHSNRRRERTRVAL